MCDKGTESRVTLKCKALGTWEGSSEVTGAGNTRKQSGGGWDVHHNGRFCFRHPGFDLLTRQLCGHVRSADTNTSSDERPGLKIKIQASDVGVSPLTQVHV